MPKKQKLELNWIGKDKQPVLEPRLLVEDPEKSYGDPHSDNMLIRGDNLLALKALEQKFAGKVKCIYIDPPYNTGNAFDQYDDFLEHSQWLNLIAPRIRMLRQLLSDNGSLWISIDDDESHYLKVMCDEIFGRKNFVCNVIWQKKYTVANDAKWFSDNHDHVLVYAKQKESLDINRLARTAEMNKAYTNPDEHLKGSWKSTPLHAKSGSNTDAYKFKNGVIWQPPEGTFRRYNDASMKRMDEEDEIWFGKNGKATPSRKTFLCELKNAGTPPKTIWLHDEVGHNHEAREEVKNVNSSDVFATPKPERLIKRVLTLGSDQGDLVLDSFLGSGTTAAVAHKMGRRWIGIELGEHCDTHCLPRFRQVCDGTDQGGISETVEWKGGGGFKYYDLAASLLKEDAHGNYVISKDYNADMLAAAMAKHEGFTYRPDQECYWKQGFSTEQDYIFTTTNHVTVALLDMIAEEMAPEEHLLVCCKKYSSACQGRHANIQIKKIPQMLMGRCEFDREDYSLKIVKLTDEENAPEFVPAGPDQTSEVKGRKVGNKNPSQGELF